MDKLELKVMYIFPGQGAQYRGMGNDLYNEYEVAKETYREASDVLDYDMGLLSFCDPEDKLNKTRYTQPALLTHSIACLRVFEKLTGGKIKPYVSAGLSVGEYSALVSADSLELREALKLVQERGELMDRYGDGTMAVFRLSADSLREIVERFKCEISGSNAIDQTIVGGLEGNLQDLSSYISKKFKIMGHFLYDNKAFHTSLFKKAANKFKPFLKKAVIKEPKSRVMSNYTGDYHSFDPEEIKDSLYFQIFNKVKWMDTKEKAFNDGVNVIVEFGGGVGEEKRPNLERLSRRAIKSSGINAVYLAAINNENIKEAANFFNGLENIAYKIDDDEPAPDRFSINGNAVAETWYSLYVPMINGIVTENSIKVISLIQELGLKDIVQLIGQSTEDNIEDLLSLVNKETKELGPYLEIAYGCELSCLLYYDGEDIIEKLFELSKRIKNRLV